VRLPLLKLAILVFLLPQSVAPYHYDHQHWRFDLFHYFTICIAALILVNFGRMSITIEIDARITTADTEHWRTVQAYQNVDEALLFISVTPTRLFRDHLTASTSVY
jgi:hypothetical protein